MAVLKVQTIAVDVVLNTRAELMGELKRGEHASRDPDHEIYLEKEEGYVGQR